MLTRKPLWAAATAAGLLTLAAPAAIASAATTAPAATAPATTPPALTFTPPRVGPISVDIAPTIINGKVIDPGLHVRSPGVSLPPISWTLPLSWTLGT
ncbi:MAG: hypothetical protein QOK21_989 [Solirubrobacteraceae bacterium]|jgi:hypothetical protein|nr:hypothetical protein [Solirubrobacteraceae bacterium]